MVQKATLYDSENEVAGKGTGKFVRSKITHFLLDLKERSDLFSLLQSLPVFFLPCVPPL